MARRCCAKQTRWESCVSVPTSLALVTGVCQVSRAPHSRYDDLTPALDLSLECLVTGVCQVYRAPHSRYDDLTPALDLSRECLVTEVCQVCEIKEETTEH